MRENLSNGGGLQPLLVFRKGVFMRYYYEKPALYTVNYGTTYRCDHPVYDECTLFEINKLGLAVIQQRNNPGNKNTYWGPIDPWLIDELYLHEKFESFFNKRAGLRQNGLYPTVTVRQIMWGLKMKPIARAQWETCFDRQLI